jgi:hypothetical protein
VKKGFTRAIASAFLGQSNTTGYRNNNIEP